jgi:hypothetical protein
MATDPSNKQGQLSGLAGKSKPLLKTGITKVAGNLFNSGSTAPKLETNIDFMQDFQWATKYRYLLRIQDFQGSMGEIIPATSITHKSESVRYENIKLPRVGTLKFPMGMELPSIQATVYDTVDCKTEWAFKEWLNSVNGFSIGNVPYLQDACKNLLICRRDENNRSIIIDSYTVIIDGDITVNLASDSGLKELVVDFIVIHMDGSTLFPYEPQGKRSATLGDIVSTVRNLGK